jgi:PhzF family phenazine biosynthesis protein
MPTVPFYQVDAFAERPFAGNPAAVVLFESWPEAALLQAIAAENNLSETAFLVPAGMSAAADYELRWFTPTVEVELCGHATLASGFVAMTSLGHAGDTVRFASKSGPLAVRHEGGRYTLDLPAGAVEPAAAQADALAAALGARPQAVHRGSMWLAAFGSEAEVAGLAPDMARTAGLGAVGVIATAPGRYVDVVSRFFAPQSGIPEDPVTGAAHCLLVPYWAERLQRSALTARQLSPRGGELACRLEGSRVALGGGCRLVIDGRLHL